MPWYISTLDVLCSHKYYSFVSPVNSTHQHCIRLPMPSPSPLPIYRFVALKPRFLQEHPPEGGHSRRVCTSPCSIFTLNLASHIFHAQHYHTVTISNHAKQCQQLILISWNVEGEASDIFLLHHVLDTLLSSLAHFTMTLPYRFMTERTWRAAAMMRLPQPPSTLPAGKRVSPGHSR